MHKSIPSFARRSCRANSTATNNILVINLEKGAEGGGKDAIDGAQQDAGEAICVFADTARTPHFETNGIGRLHYI